MRPAIDRWHIARAPATADADRATLGFEEQAVTEADSKCDTANAVQPALRERAAPPAQSNAPSPSRDAPLGSTVGVPAGEKISFGEKITLPKAPRVVDPPATTSRASPEAEPPAARHTPRVRAAEPPSNDAEPPKRAAREASPHLEAPRPREALQLERPKSPSLRAEIRLMPPQTAIAPPRRLSFGGFESARVEPPVWEPAPVYVHIGRIDVKAADSPAAPKAQPARTAPPKPSLEAHLRSRDRGVR